MNNFLAYVFVLTDFMSLAKLPIQVSVVTTNVRLPQLPFAPHTPGVEKQLEE